MEEALNPEEKTSKKKSIDTGTSSIRIPSSLPNAISDAYLSLQDLAKPFVSFSKQASEIATVLNQPSSITQQLTDFVNNKNSLLATQDVARFSNNSTSSSVENKNEEDIKKLEQQLRKVNARYFEIESKFQAFKISVDESQKKLEIIQTEQVTIQDRFKETEEKIKASKIELEETKKKLEDAKEDLEKNKIKVIETLGIFTALFALISNAIDQWTVPLFIAFAATIFIFLFLMHYLLTGEQKILQAGKPIFKLSVILLLLALGIYIGTSWHDWVSNLPHNLYIGNFENKEPNITPSSSNFLHTLPILQDNAVVK